MKKLIPILLLLFGGCGGYKKTTYDFPQLPDPVNYQTVWVEPSIVLSDSLFTLIRADRVDSVLIENNSDSYRPIINSVEFFISQPRCFTVINILNTRGQVVVPLVAENLAFGYYQLSLNQSALSRIGLAVGGYDLRSESCVSTVSSRFVLSP